MNGFVRIREFEESYTSTEKLIAKYILEHGNEILNYSAHKKNGRCIYCIVFCQHILKLPCTRSVVARSDKFILTWYLL